MITSYEVGTIFKIIDRSVGVRRSMIADMERLEQLTVKTKRNFSTLGSLNLGKLNRAVGGLTEQVFRMQGAVDKTFAGIATGTDTAIKQTQALAAEWRSVAVAARSAGVASGSASRVRSAGSFMQPGAASGGRGHFGFHVREHGELPGGSRFGVVGGGLAGNAALVAAGALGYGVYEDAQLQNTVARMMLAAGQPLNAQMMSTRIAQQIRKSIQGGMVETGLSAKDLEGSAMKLTTQMGGIPFGQRVGILPDIFRFAGIESLLKGVDAGDATQALVGMLHMTGAYKPEQIKKLAGQVAFASTISPVGLPGIERAASYVLPMSVNALGLDPATLLLVMAQAQSAGILSGKSGTWFQGMFQALSPKAGFASLISGKGAAGRQSGLRELGLVDDKGDPSGLRMLEKNDWSGFIGTVKQHLDAIPQEKRMGVVSQAMGSQQAARGLMTLMLPAMIKLLPELQREQKNFANDPTKTLNDFANASPVMQFQRTWEQMSNVLMDIGDIAMPLVLGGLRAFDALLKDIDGPLKWIIDHMPHASAASQTHGTNTQGGGIVFGTARALGSIGKWLNGSGGSAPDSAAVGAPNAVKTITVPGSSVTGSLLAPGGAGPLSSIFHKTAFIGSGFQPSNTWSDIGQGSPYSIPFPTTTGDGPTVGGMPIIKASYSPSGSGVSVFGGGAGGGVASAPMGNVPITMSKIGSNAYIAARRLRFAQELKDPAKRLQFAGMLLSESSGTDAGRVATAESAMNRSDFAHKSLMQMLHSGFYGPINHGMLPQFMARLQRDPKLMAKMNSAISTALGGSDVIKGHTDQGMISDPGGRWEMAHSHAYVGQVFGDWLRGKGTSAWRQRFESDAAAHAGAPPHWSTGDIASALHMNSPVIPPASSKPIVIQHTSMLDGRIVAENTMRHIVKAGNGPARGPRTADYTAVRPINV